MIRAMSFLPPELIFDILSRLPLKDLMRFLCVSKAWHALIHDQFFIKTHLQRSIETNSAPLTILLRKFSPECPSHFFSLPFNDNETIGTAVKIKQPLKCPDEFTDILLGYSVHGLGSQAHIYSLKSNSWKRIQDMPCNCYGVHPTYLMFCNGALSCLVQNRLEKNRHIILNLSLAGEKYCQFCIPVDPDNESRLGLEVLGGCLILYDTFLETQHDVWIMKEYGVTESWTLLYSIEGEDLPWSFDFLFTPLVISNYGVNKSK
ncbi:F-box/kelch-repeat protein At3g06240-like [Prunus avium]|uniref:F-box/kelch-repeat protein At3g06240-like n=1 Tax=Prunus avium TaxID=42229 RepID=A0A6P5SY03_PRUAV|nr:F-box/kelch-repeat protein At3g06240-like [Prunus avium]